MPIFTDTHALVKFLEKEVTSIVPVKWIQEKEMPQYNGSCSMVWSNKMIYEAVLLFSCLYVCSLLCVRISSPWVSCK